MANKKELENILRKQRREAEERQTKRKARELGLPYLDLVTLRTPTEFKAMSLVLEKEAREALLVPVQVVGEEITVAVNDPENEKTKKMIEKLKENYSVSLALASMTGLERTWRHYEHIEEGGEEITGSINIDAERIESIEKEIKTAEDLKEKIKNFKSTKTSKLLEIVMGASLALRASDIHFEAGKEKNSLRFRVDGVLHVAYEDFSEREHKSLITRIKLLSGLKLNVRSEPQDGRFTMSLPGRDIELRVSTIPSEYGETAVLRILDPNALKTKLEELGWRKDDLEIIKKELKRPTGLVLNTGPTGSGKTTTLYAFLQGLVSPEIKIITIEDPIEYHLKGISQTQTDESSGYTFAGGLRSIVRQDPDVILVGEIRDGETANIAMQASLTGHKVFSTLHTNDAAGAIPRLLELGADTNSIGTALNLVIAQRLVRVLCEHCKKRVKIENKELEKIKEFVSKLPKRVNKKDYEEIELHEKGSCNECRHLGYRGRMGIFELFVVTDKIKDIIYENPTSLNLFKSSKEDGMVSMQEDGVLKAIKGVTTFEEVERTTGPIEWLL